MARIGPTSICRWQKQFCSPRENGKVEFQAAFFDVFNHPQFANPDNDLASPTFSVISSTAVNPRVGQLALKFIF